MSSQLDPAILAAITAEARQCFLDEDAPEYLEMLEQGITDRDNPDFTNLLRAAHSLKGGAGLASLTSLQHLAHKLEDVMLGIQQEQIQELDLAWALVEKSIDEVGYVLSQARNVDNAIANPELIVALESLVESNLDPSEQQEKEASNGDSNPNALLHHTLKVDLEGSFIAIEELELDTPEEVIQPILASFIDECTFISETLELPWLGEAIAPIAASDTVSDTVEALLLTKEIILQLRTQIDDYLSNLASSQESQLEEPTDNSELIINTLNQDLEEICQAIADLSMDTPEELINQALAGFSEECTFIGETLELPWLIELVTPIEALIAETEPLEALLTVQELVGEIRQQRDTYLENLADVAEEESVFLDATNASFADNYEAEEVDQEGFFDFGEADDEVESTTVIFAPALGSQEKIVAKVAQASPKVSSTANQVKIPLDRLQDMTNNIEELILTYSRFGRQQELLNQANRRLRSLTRQFEPIREQIQDLYNELAIGSSDLAKKARSANQDSEDNSDSFDSLEMDNYTDLHSSLQSFQELMLQIQETRTDIDFVDRELGEDVEQTRKNLNNLYSEVTDSRLVPFDLLAKRFVPQIRGLSQRFDKQVELKIEGKNTPFDQILLEQLQTPLTHLLNNAFDHGIESKYERFSAGKPEQATICLTSKLEKNNLVIIIEDDGGGINPQKVYNRAVERGICPSDKSIKDFDQGEILNWIFEPDFSTAAQVSDISGRGMGLDIVLNLIRQLKGQLNLETEVGLGTTFTITLPLNLSLQSLLLVKLQNNLIAIPHTSIREILPYRDLDFTDTDKKQINWQEKVISLSAASNLFPRPRQPLNISQGKVAIVLETAFEPIAILVDDIVTEEKLIIKPFDETIPVPPYIAGCAVLGSGEVLPVILPQGLEQETIFTSSARKEDSTVANTVSTILIAEDSIATRRMLEKILTSVGYQVIVCRDGQEALEQVNQYKGRIDLILSDVEMPRLNGFQLLAKVRAKAAFKKTPIVMATSRTGERHKHEAKRLGATDYLGKPVQPQQLIDTVSALLKQKV